MARAQFWLLVLTPTSGSMGSCIPGHPYMYFTLEKTYNELKGHAGSERFLSEDGLKHDWLRTWGQKLPAPDIDLDNTLGQNGAQAPGLILDHTSG